MDALCEALNVKNTFGKAEADRLFQPEPAPSLARMRQMNDVLIRYSKVRDMIIPRDIWTQVHKNVRTSGAPIERRSKICEPCKIAGMFKLIQPYQWDR